MIADNPFEINEPATTINEADPFGVPNLQTPAQQSPSEMSNPFGQPTFNTPTFGNNNSNSNQQKRKYRFIQLYYLINPKLFAKQKLESGEVPLLEINYNVDYSNLRFTFTNAKPDTFDKTSLKVLNTERLTTVNIYPETAEQVLWAIENGNKLVENYQIYVFERVLNQGNSGGGWSPNQTVFKFIGDSVVIITQPTNSSNTFTYVFSEWQKQALVKSLKFMTEGTAWLLDQVKFNSND
jgi:hypothetical protein